MSKKRLILDFDGVISDSILAYCEAYNFIYQYHKDFKPAKWWEVETWNMREQCPLVNNPNDIFSSPIFFDYCEFINPNTKEVIEELCQIYDVSICSIGTKENITNKIAWLKEYLPCVKKYEMIIDEECKMNKSSVNMEGAIFIDDVKANLDSSNAEIKICFGDEYAWNIEWDGFRCFNWIDVRELLWI